MSFYEQTPTNALRRSSRSGKAVLIAVFAVLGVAALLAVAGLVTMIVGLVTGATIFPMLGFFVFMSALLAGGAFFRGVSNARGAGLTLRSLLGSVLLLVCSLAVAGGILALALL